MIPFTVCASEPASTQQATPSLHSRAAISTTVCASFSTRSTHRHHHDQSTLSPPHTSIPTSRHTSSARVTPHSLNPEQPDAFNGVHRSRCLSSVHPVVGIQDKYPWSHPVRLQRSLHPAQTMIAKIVPRSSLALPASTSEFTECRAHHIAAYCSTGTLT